MRSPEEVFEDIEGDRALREREIRLIENIAARAKNEEEHNMLHRSLILLTYAHFEGFCKFALLAYTAAVNTLGLPCREACTPLVAATLGKVFAALRDVNSKHEEFARGLPEDRDLHLMARERIFIDRFEAILATKVELTDKLVDTKSNLNSVLLKRIFTNSGWSTPSSKSTEETSTNCSACATRSLTATDLRSRPPMRSKNTLRPLSR